MDSPTRSARNDFDTRFSTPVSELDDHRHQDPIPPADPDVFNGQRRGSAVVVENDNESPARRGTAASARPMTLTLLAPPPREASDGPIARDFENALTEDEGNEGRTPVGVYTNRSPRRHRSHHSTRGAMEDRLDVDDDENIAVTSRSSSPPNSVDAFAEPRRRERAYTADSRMQPELAHERTISGGTNRRRPTVNGSVRDYPGDNRSLPEDDVCFPRDDEPTHTFTVDFEAIEEFVAESRRNENVALNRRHSYTSSALGQPAQANLPQITKIAPSDHSASQLPWTESDSTVEPKTSATEFDEKLVDLGQQQERKASVADDQRFSFFSSEIEQTIHVSNIGDLVVPGETFRDLFELPGDSGVWWLDVMNPTDDEIDMFQKAFGIHRLTAEDIQQQESREKVELFKSYYFVSFRTFVMDKEHEDYLDAVMMYIVVFRDGILTCSFHSNPHASHVRRRIGKLRNYINLTGDWICYALVDDIVDCFGPPINEIELEADQIEDQVFTLRAEDSIPLLRSIGDCRKRVTSLMRLLGGKADVIKGFAKRCNEQYSMTPRSDIGLYLGDIQDHVVTMMSNLTANDKMLSRSHANYLAHLSVDNLRQGNKANKVLSQITVLASLLVPMNLITGLFGMNVPVPGGVSPGPLYGFFAIVASIIVFVSGGFYIAKKRRFV